MSSKLQLDDLHWISEGANCHVYEVNRFIAVKVPKPGDQEREQFRKEVKVLDILSSHPPCPYVVSCFLHNDDCIFLEYMRDICLSCRIQQNHTRDGGTMRVVRVDKLEPLSLRKIWMSYLARGVAFLESLNLAHGDLRPENILLDRNRLKLSDFDCTSEIGSVFEACIAPYGRLLGREGGPDEGTAGLLGPRTEQFALGSLFYLINYGFKVYGDQCLGDDPSGREHGPAVLDLLQAIVFPELSGEAVIDSIIRRCWHGEYRTVIELATDTVSLLCAGDVDRSKLEDSNIPQEESLLHRRVCEDLVASGLPKALSSQSPRGLGKRMNRRYTPYLRESSAVGRLEHM
ncbi:serine/threonine protein kinase [Arthroderma uncinatum]|uniref:serine/threonine protein kinase n=1 Tax=Arthroderma uncinatum TaxID=74035 RepID=UPI00144A9622|nr:serine/threonine protein kinase [Arthroderma uncinatum]KAF3491951.1 serine/threonine protein kinase [Arthroderma uncinatum]